MKKSGPRRTGLSTPLELAESRFYAWAANVLRPEYDQQIELVLHERLPFAGLGAKGMSILETCLNHAIKKRMDFYRQIAAESGKAAMFDEAPLDEFRTRTEKFVECSINALRDAIYRHQRALGEVVAQQAIDGFEFRLEALKGRLLDGIRLSTRAMRRYVEPVGERIDRLRRECGWSQLELALKVGIATADKDSRKLVGQHIRGEVIPRPKTLGEYAQVFSRHLGRPIDSDLRG